MTDQLQHKNSAGGNEATLPAEFIAVCVLAFVAGVSATVYFCHSMCCEMEMPGGWTMSMMWMRMPGQTWFGSALSFHFMWLAMMVAMMLPSALPTFLKQRRTPASLSVMATGYFAAWMALGVGIYALGVAFAAAAMRWEVFTSRSFWSQGLIGCSSWTGLRLNHGVRMSSTAKSWRASPLWNQRRGLPGQPGP